MRLTRTATLALALCVAGCSGKREAPSGGGQPREGLSQQTSSASVATPSPETKAVELAGFKFGRALGPDGTATGEGGPFAEGEPLHATYRVNNAPPGSNTKIVVTSLADKRKLHEDQKAPSGPQNAVAFTLPDTRTWSQGDYRLEMQLVEGDKTRTLGVFDFKLGPPKR
jgi:hypothetical protein